MLPANVDKVKGMLQKSFQGLPMATDLPRLANIKIVHDGTEIPGPDTASSTLDKLNWIFSTLTRILEGPEAAEATSEKFRAAFAEDASASGTISKNQVTTLLTSIGGDDSPVVKVLKPVNQVAISPAIIELKTLLGLDNMTKDVRNSWFFVIKISDANITVSSHKRDQCIKNLFQMEWVLLFTLARPSFECLDVTLQVDDLVFSADCHSKRPDKKEEVKRILKRYTPDDVLALADTKVWCAIIFFLRFLLYAIFDSDLLRRDFVAAPIAAITLSSNSNGTQNATPVAVASPSPTPAEKQPAPYVAQFSCSSSPADLFCL